jgi:hypothetical protein
MILRINLSEDQELRNAVRGMVDEQIRGIIRQEVSEQIRDVLAKKINTLLAKDNVEKMVAYSNSTFSNARSDAFKAILEALEKQIKPEMVQDIIERQIKKGLKLSV